MSSEADDDQKMPVISGNRYIRTFGELRLAPRELWVVYLLKFLESYAYYCMSYTLLLYLSEEFGFTDRQAGWTYGIMGLLISVYGFFVGFIIDNLGVRASLCLGFSLNVASRAIIAFTQNPHVLTTVLFTSLPLGSALGIPVMSIGIRRYTTPKNRTVAFALFYVMMNLAALVAAPAIDAFRRSFRTTVVYHGITVTPYRLLLLSGCFMTLVALIVAIFMVREINVNSKHYKDAEDSSDDEVEARTFTPKRASPFEIARQVCGDVRFWKFLALVVLLLGVRLVFRHLDATFPKYMVREFGPDVLFGTIIGINPLLIIILVPLLSPILAHIDPYTAIMFGTAISGISPLILVIGAHYWTAIAFVSLLSVGEAIWSPRLYEYTVSIADEGREGTFMALGNVPTFVATLLAGGMSGYLLEEFCPLHGERRAWMMWLIIGTISTLSPILICSLQSCLRIRPDERDSEQAAEERREQRRAARAAKGTLVDTPEVPTPTAFEDAEAEEAADEAAALLAGQEETEQSGSAAAAAAARGAGLPGHRARRRSRDEEAGGAGSEFAGESRADPLEDEDGMDYLAAAREVHRPRHQGSLN